MRREMKFKLLWTVWMAGGGVAAGVVTWLATASVLWTIVAVLGSGVVLNALGQMVVQPVRAARHSHPQEGQSASS